MRVHGFEVIVSDEVPPGQAVLLNGVVHVRPGQERDLSAIVKKLAETAGLITNVR